MKRVLKASGALILAFAMLLSAACSDGDDVEKGKKDKKETEETEETEEEADSVCNDLIKAVKKDGAEEAPTPYGFLDAYFDYYPDGKDFVCEGIYLDANDEESIEALKKYPEVDSFSDILYDYDEVALYFSGKNDPDTDCTVFSYIEVIKFTDREDAIAQFKEQQDDFRKHYDEDEFTMGGFASADVSEDSEYASAYVYESVEAYPEAGIDTSYRFTSICYLIGNELIYANEYSCGSTLSKGSVGSILEEMGQYFPDYFD